MNASPVWEKKKHRIAINPASKVPTDPEKDGMVFGPMAYRKAGRKPCGCGQDEFLTTHVPTGYAMLAFTSEPGAIEYCEKIAALPFVYELKTIDIPKDWSAVISQIGTAVRNKFPWEASFQLCAEHSEDEERSECYACGRSCDCQKTRRKSRGTCFIRDGRRTWRRSTSEIKVRKQTEVSDDRR